MANTNSIQADNRQRSGFESAWDAAPAGCALIPARVERFDPTSALLFAPQEYQYRELKPCRDEPATEDWIRNAFMSFVKGEFGTATSRGGYANSAGIQEPVAVSEDLLFRYLERCENDILYGQLVDAVAKVRGGMAERLYALLTSKLVGNQDNLRAFTSQSFSALVTPQIDRQLRLRFILPAFPFKDQNMFRTEAPASHVDLAEVALLVRLHIMALAIFRVHPFGADLIVISDGPAYAPIFHVDPTEVAEYRHRLIGLRNMLNLFGTVSIIDLRDLTQRLFSREAGFDVFDKTVQEIAQSLRSMLANGEKTLVDTFRVLVRGMKWNLNLKGWASRVEKAQLWEIANAEAGTSLDSSLLPIWEEVDEMSVEAAYSYAAFNLALRYHYAFDQLLPQSLRATMHPKKGQIAVPKVGDVFPWNGVATVRDFDFGPNSIETVPLYRLTRQFSRVVPHVLHGQKAALYYHCGSGDSGSGV